MNIIGLPHILGLLMSWSFVTKVGTVMLEDADIAGDEILVSKYYQYKNELKWPWSVHSFCRTLCRRRQSVHEATTSVKTREVLLEAADCMKVEMDVFECACELRRPGRIVKMFYGRDTFISGLNGEIYELRMACGQCHDNETKTIYERLIGSEDTSLKIPQVWGIARLAEAYNIQRQYSRAWNRKRAEGKIPNSSSVSSEEK